MLCKAMTLSGQGRNRTPALALNTNLISSLFMTLLGTPGTALDGNRSDRHSQNQYCFGQEAREVSLGLASFQVFHLSILSLSRIFIC